MKIFGIGLSRTGTNSLTLALKELGYNAIHYPQPPLLPELLEVVKQYDALTDSPIAIAYKELDVNFPCSKFILTTRSLKSWLKSCANFRRFMRELNNKEFSKVRELLYGCKKFNKEKFIKAYNKHHEDVEQYFEENKQDLLVMDITNGDGWEKLCKFLGKEIPAWDFPHKNKGNYT